MKRKTKKLIARGGALLFILAIICCLLASGVGARASTLDCIAVTSYEAGVDYAAKMNGCLEDGSEYALQMGRIYELQRNLKINSLGMSQYKETNYFRDYKTAEEIRMAMNRATAKYTSEDLDLLSRVVFAEAGCSWFPDWVQQGVASVVINRKNSPHYPNTIHDVIYQPGQYGCVNNGSIYTDPTQQCINNARKVLEEGSTLPSGVVGQSGYPTGRVEKSYYDPVLNTTIYFFY